MPAPQKRPMVGKLGNKYGKVNTIGIIRSKIASKPINAGLATFLNPYSYLILRKAPNILQQMDAIYIDGIALVLALRILGIKARRQSMDMTSLAPLVLRDAAANQLPVHFVGGRDGIAREAADRLCHYLNIGSVSAYPGYFESDTMRNLVITSIARSPSSLVLVGMGAINQEKLMIDLRAAGHRGAIYSCGGFFHQTAASLQSKYYPDWIDRFNLRWIWRIFREPRLIKRYGLEYPKFVGVFLADAARSLRRY